MIGLRFFPLKSADVRGAGMCDEALRTSAWQAMIPQDTVTKSLLYNRNQIMLYLGTTR